MPVAMLRWGNVDDATSMAWHHGGLMGHYGRNRNSDAATTLSHSVIGFCHQRLMAHSDSQPNATPFICSHFVQGVFVCFWYETGTVAAPDRF